METQQQRHYKANRQSYINRALLWKKNNPDKVRESRRKDHRKASGVVNPTGETKTGPCEICGKEDKLVFDHCHSTGVFRGWICSDCNTALGWFEKIVREGLEAIFLRYLNRAL